MLKTILDSIPKLALSVVQTRVVKVIKIDAGGDVKIDVDTRALTPLAGTPVAVVTLEETEAVAVEPGRYVMVAVFVRLP